MDGSTDKCLTPKITSASSTPNPAHDSSKGLMEDEKKTFLEELNRELQNQEQEDKLEMEGVQLERYVEDLKGSIRKVGRELREKEKTAGRLRGVITKLKARAGEQSSNSMEGLKEDNQVLGGPLDTVLLLPEKIWALIFGKLMDPRDLWSCYNTCPLFQQWLHPGKTSWTLELAIPHLQQHHQRRSRDLQETVERAPICESWHSVLNLILENHPSLRPHQDGSDPRRLDFIYLAKEAGIDWNFYRFSDDPEDDHPWLDLEAPAMPKVKRHGRIPVIGRFVNLMRDRLTSGPKDNHLHPNIPASEVPIVGRANGKPPFLGRYLNLVLGRVKLTNPENQDETETEKKDSKKWWRQLYNFLDLFGSEIWYLTLFILVDSKRHGWVKNKLKHFLTIKLFQSCPNLRKLEIALNMDRDCDLRIKPKSFLSAPKLETLEFDYSIAGYQVPQALANRFHAQLRKLNMYARHMADIKALDWPNLVELHLVDLGLAPVQRHWGFRWLLGVKMPQLKKLGLVFSGVVKGEKVSVEHLMELINGLSCSTPLSTLRLVGPLHGLCFQEGEKVHSAPRTLKTLEIADPWKSSSSSMMSFDFLFRCFPFLENLSVFFLGRETRFYNMEVNLMSQAELKKMASEIETVEELFVEMNMRMCDGQMYSSNVWEMLPLLKVFTFQRDVFTREGYEARFL